MAKQDDYIRYTIRVPQETYNLVTSAAEESGRSINGEIVARLTESFERRTLDLSDEGIVAVLRRTEAVAEALEWLFLFFRDVELDEFIADNSRAGVVMTRTETVEFIIRQYLGERGYVRAESNHPHGILGKPK